MHDMTLIVIMVLHITDAAHARVLHVAPTTANKLNVEDRVGLTNTLQADDSAGHHILQPSCILNELTPDHLSYLPTLFQLQSQRPTTC